MHSGSGEIEEITVLLAGLEITIIARPAGSSTNTPILIGSATSASPTPRIVSNRPVSVVDHILGFDPVSQSLSNRVLRASTPATLAGLPLSFLDHLSSRLRSSHPEWTAKARIARAFKAGLVARLRLEGQYSELSSEGVPFRSSSYIVLRCPNYPDGFWTANYTTYSQQVFTPAREFHPNSISHGFATQAEGEAYLVGAGRPWPTRLE